MLELIRFAPAYMHQTLAILQILHHHKYGDPRPETYVDAVWCNAGGTVSMIMLELVRLSCVILAAYPLEFDTKMSNVRLPFISLLIDVF